MRRVPWQAGLALLLVLLALVLPESGVGRSALGQGVGGLVLLPALLAAGAATLALARPRSGAALGLVLLAVHAAALLTVLRLDGLEAQAMMANAATGQASGQGRYAGSGFFVLVAGLWLLAWWCVERLAALQPVTPFLARIARLTVPFLFGVWLLLLWELIVRGAGVPPVLLPPPSRVAARIATSLPILLADFRQTFLKAVIAGYLIGSLSGFLVALLADRVPFLKRGLIPVGNLVSALPIIGIAPIMVMWFGFDWQSKAAVVVVMTFFPMLVNTVAGLSAADRMSRDLLATYAANHAQTLLKLRLPAAMPFVFNALKINATLALIGAIVAEFFGTPIVGMGFRISTEVGRMNIDMVWAEIALAALAGSGFYALVGAIERRVTFWHPSVRNA